MPQMHHLAPVERFENFPGETDILRVGTAAIALGGCQGAPVAPGVSHGAPGYFVAPV